MSIKKLLKLFSQCLTNYFFYEFIIRLTFFCPSKKKTNNFFLSTKKTNRKMIALVIQYFLYINITYKLITTVI